MEITKQNILLATIYRPLNNYFLTIYGIFKKKYVCKNQIKRESNVKECIEYLKKIFYCINDRSKSK